MSKADLGPRASDLAAGSLLVDYILSVAVSIAAGAAVVVSAFPAPTPPPAWRLTLSRCQKLRVRWGLSAGQTVLGQITEASLGRGAA